MNIKQIIQQPESKTLEFKRDLSSLSTVLKTIVAFANTAGGTLIIGRDDDGSLRGVEEIFAAEESLSNAIAEGIHPPILPEIEIATVDGRNLIIVRVSHWRGPFYIKRLGLPRGVYVRLGSTSRPAPTELIDEMRRFSTNTCYDQEPVTAANEESLDSRAMSRAFDAVGKVLDSGKLHSMGILVASPKGSVPSIGGLLIFGRPDERQLFVPDARIRCARFAGVTKTNMIDHLEIEHHLLDAISAVPQFITRNTRTAQPINAVRDFRRAEIPEYSMAAVREVLVNAIAHADYSIVGSHVQVGIYDDRLEIQSPGMLPLGFTLEDLKAGISRVRNRVVVRILRELRIMEEWGSGYRRAVDICEKEGYPIPEWVELGSAVRVTLFPHSASVLPEIRTAIESGDLTSRQKSILQAMSREHALSLKEIRALLGASIAERTLRRELVALRNVGNVKMEGNGPATKWLKL